MKMIFVKTYLQILMPPAPAIAGGKGLRAFADCRRQTQTGKTGKKGGKYW